MKERELAKKNRERVRLSSIPTVFASLQAHAIARWFLRSAGRATILPMTPRVGFYSRCSALCVMQAEAKFTYILELTFKQQIFMIFIVDYFYQKEFLKIEKFEVRGQSF